MVHPERAYTSPSWNIGVTSRACVVAGLVLLAVVAAGCASFGRGVTEAVLDAQNRETEDARMCEVAGRAFTGIAPMLAAQARHGPLSADRPQRPTLKFVYIHGIGNHQPGHGSVLARSLADTLGLTVRAERAKRVVLTPPDGPERPYGEVNIVRMVDVGRTREMLYFEHTWSSIAAAEKESISFDDSVIYRSRRAAVNQRIREFSNGALPDPLAFIGTLGADIRGSVGEVLCWAHSATWDDLPPLTRGRRCSNTELHGSRIGKDDIVLATHSLGSRAAVDALQQAAGQVAATINFTERGQRLTTKLKNTQVTLFMLSNQLPLLEAGLPRQEVTGQHATYCAEGAARYDERFLQRLNMVAFSDPNDILSYPVPIAWVDQYLDSRLCVDVRNVAINIANVRRVPVLGEYADPIAAHRGYDSDARVAELMAYGIGHEETSELVRERCRWIEQDATLD